MTEDRILPVGFWSCSRRDDQLSGYRLGRLRLAIKDELELQLGRSDVDMLQDVNEFPGNETWERSTLHLLQRSYFFIPVITPNYISNQWCYREVSTFLDREKTIKNDEPAFRGVSLMFPLRYIDPKDDQRESEFLNISILRERQWFDFTNFRYTDLDDEEVRGAISHFVAAIRDALHGRLDTIADDGDQTPIHASAASWTGRTDRKEQARIVISLAPAAIEGVRALLEEQEARLHNGPPEAIEQSGVQALRDLHEALGTLIHSVETNQGIDKPLSAVARLSERVFEFAAETGELCVAGMKPLLASLPAAWGTWTLLGMICNPATFAALGPAAAVAVSAGYFGLDLKKRSTAGP